ncbi:hypothetical protein G6011_08940 [Alternaria panax]|uniref:Uncharacterized protein n=1 Tax=Alternaria panax TaxID=48097 RepID=A0AAD4NNB6_9PLEO|nr:hypothetical protein G6011_08940 [Alternaria panax]
MATSDTVSSFSVHETSRLPAPHGQGMSKAARARRNRTDKKKAISKDLNDAISSPDQAVPKNSANTIKNNMTEQNTNSIAKVASATDTDLSASASDSLPKKPSQLSPSAVVNQALDNLLEMIRPQRRGLLQGPHITIHVGDTSVTDIPKRAAMAASSVLHKHFVANPESLEYCFSRGQIHPGAVRFLLIGWMRETCNEFEAYAIPAQKTFGENVAILRAARLLGMERYCRHILISYVDYLKTQLPSYEEISAVEQNTTSDKDPLWTAMVNHLCHDRFKGLIPNAEEFEAFLENHTRLKKAMESADNFFAVYAKQQAEGREREHRQHWEQIQAEKRQRIAKEQLAVESLKKKLDEKGSGLMSVTADEAEVLRGRTRTR